jgi:hypothetical protein
MMMFSMAAFFVWIFRATLARESVYNSPMIHCLSWAGGSPHWLYSSTHTFLDGQNEYTRYIP